MLPNHDAARSTPAPRNPFTLDTSEAQKYGASSLAEMAALLRKEAARIEQLSAVGFDTTAPTYSNGQDSRQFVVTSQQSLPPASSLIAAFTPEAVAKEVPSYTTPGFNSSLASGTLEAGNVAAARLAQLRGTIGLSIEAPNSAAAMLSQLRGADAAGNVAAARLSQLRGEFLLSAEPDPRRRSLSEMLLSPSSCLSSRSPKDRFGIDGWSDDASSCETIQGPARAGLKSQLKQLTDTMPRSLVAKEGQTSVPCKCDSSSTRCRCARRLNKSSSNMLRRWFIEHWEWPYPSSTQAEELSRHSGATPYQIRNFFINQRRAVLKAAKNNPNEKLPKWAANRKTLHISDTLP